MSARAVLSGVAKSERAGAAVAFFVLLSPFRSRRVIPDPRREECLSPRQSHGLKALKRAVKTLGSRTTDQRTKVGKALAAYRDNLIADLGGAENLSRQEHLLIEEVIITTLLLSRVNAWLLAQKTLVSKKTRGVIAAVRDRNSLVLTLKGLLESLGLKRRAKPLPSLAEILASGKPSPHTQFSQSSESGSQPEEPAGASTEGTS